MSICKVITKPEQVRSLNSCGPPDADCPRKGFALVATLTLMILLALIAVGLLSLSTVTLRTTGQVSAMSEAQANARMALVMAIGELQKQMGPDQRISANGSILSDSQVEHPHWTGVWDSWIAGPLSEAPINENYPTAESHHQTLNQPSAETMRPDYNNKDKHFRAWLVSLDPSEASDPQAPVDLALQAVPLPSSASEAVQLVGVGSLGAAAGTTNHVGARLMDVSASEDASPRRGRYAWWVGDESQKARVMDDSWRNEAVPTTAQKIARAQAPGSTGTRTIKGLQLISAEDEAKLDGLPTLNTLDIVPRVEGNPSSENFYAITPFSRAVLADVREGGLKRDLSTILERRISTAEASDEFMLYRFDSAGRERVPIQDLAAFYQLYDQSRYVNTTELWRRGVVYNSNQLPNAIQILQPDLGKGSGQADRFLRQYAKMYTNPVPVKIQILVTMTAHPITPAPTEPGANTHFIRLHMMPSVTLWNPTNLPMVMNPANDTNFAQQMRFMAAGFNLNWIKNGAELSPARPLNLSFAAMGGEVSSGRPGWGNRGGKKATIFDMYFATQSYPVVLEPGEVRMFSYDRASAGTAPFSFAKNARDLFQPHQQAATGWNPDVLFPMAHSIWGGTSQHAHQAGNGNRLFAVRIDGSNADKFAIRLSTDLGDNTDYSHDSEFPGTAFGYMLIQNNHQSRSTGLWGFRNYPLLSRNYTADTAQNSYGQRTNTEFNDALVRKGFPKEVITKTRNAKDLLQMTQSGEHWPLFQFSLMSAVETNEETGNASFGGRKFASRPFLHSSPLSPPRIDQNNNNAFYNYGLNWWVEEVNSILEANVQVDGDNRRGYFGGGYTPDYGTTHVVQQEIPIVPPLSIAALNQALLGGFSLAADAPNLGNPVVSAVGVNGLFPFTVSAIGNSYAHPLLAPDLAYSQVQRLFNTSAGERTVTFADHSYLANKALWDEFFFSSVTPQNSAVRPFGTSQNISALKLAEDFFFDDKSLPNRRLQAYLGDLNDSKLTDLFGMKDQYIDGLADRIASHLMVQGPFNVNSTSAEAWRIFFSSLKGKPVAYLEHQSAMTANALRDATPEGVPVSGLALPLGLPIRDSNADPSDPDQWLGWRELTDEEIGELAVAMVKQVKARGPFLSLSEFVNRRLDAGNPDLAVKGALQAAIDDPDVSINAGFRNPARIFSEEEKNSMTPAFPQAMEGAIAYGSAAYVDQADLLRNFSEQLTPRGDTFVIRAYGDSIDASGNVVARAWCEAVVQRVPDYLDSSEESHLKTQDLVSQSNRTFGRRMQIIGFRWLNPSEI